MAWCKLIDVYVREGDECYAEKCECGPDCPEYEEKSEDDPREDR